MIPLPAHSALGASGASRWFKCHASASHAALLSKEEQRSSEYAEEGTLAHELGEQWLLTDRRPDGDWEMLDAVEVYVNFVKASTPVGARLFIEEKFRLYEVEGKVPMFGTADAVIWDTSTNRPTLHVIDYKHGVGIPVAPHDNPQLLYYALGVWHQLGRPVLDSLRLTIVQPRSIHKGPKGAVQTWEVESPNWTLSEFEATLVRAVAAVEKSPWKYVAGKHCQFCPVAGRCPTHMDYALKDLPLTDHPKLMTDEALRDALLMAQRVRIWLKRMTEEADARAASGRLPPGMKLVAGRKTRVWRDPAEARQRLLDYGVDPEEVDTVDVISPAAAEGILGRETMEKFNDLIDYRYGKPLLVDVTDFREAIGSEVQFALEGLFDEL